MAVVEEWARAVSVCLFCGRGGVFFVGGWLVGFGVFGERLCWSWRWRRWRVGVLIAVWGCAVLLLAAGSAVFLCAGCCAVPCFRQGQTPGGV